MLPEPPVAAYVPPLGCNDTLQASRKDDEIVKDQGRAKEKRTSIRVKAYLAQ